MPPVVVSGKRAITTTQSQTATPLYDELLFAGKPDLTPFGLRRYPLYYESDLFPPGGTVPDEPKVRQAAQQLIASGHPVDEPVGLDVEKWNWHTMQVSQAEATATMNKLNQILGWFKSEAPQYTKVGYYSVGPNREYYAGQPGNPDFAAWQASNTFLAPIIATQHILQPSIYTFYNDPPAWVNYANANMNEAVRIGGGRPIYPFLWPQYHEGGDMHGNYIDYDFWTLHLQTIAAHPGTTGIILWADFDPWNASWPWWQATRDFIASGA